MNINSASVQADRYFVLYKKRKEIVTRVFVILNVRMQRVNVVRFISNTNPEINVKSEIRP